MKVITATAISTARSVTTKYGDRQVLDAMGTNGEKYTVWRPANDPAIQAIAANQPINLAIDSKGKISLLETEPAAIPTAKPAVINPDEGMPPALKTAIASYVAEQARLFGFCLKQAQGIEGINPEDVRPTATTLYLQAVKHFSL